MLQYLEQFSMGSLKLLHLFITILVKIHQLFWLPNYLPTSGTGTTRINFPIFPISLSFYFFSDISINFAGQISSYYLGVIPLSLFSSSLYLVSLLQSINAMSKEFIGTLRFMVVKTVSGFSQENLVLKD